MSTALKNRMWSEFRERDIALNVNLGTKKGKYSAGSARIYEVSQNLEILELVERQMKEVEVKLRKRYRELEARETVADDSKYRIHHGLDPLCRDLRHPEVLEPREARPLRRTRSEGEAERASASESCISVLIRVGDQACALWMGQMNLVTEALDELVCWTPAVRCFHRNLGSFKVGEEVPEVFGRVGEALVVYPLALKHRGLTDSLVKVEAYVHLHVLSPPAMFWFEEGLKAGGQHINQKFRRKPATRNINMCRR
jgi:hypothetical protein